MEHVYNTIGENFYPLEEIWMHTCGRLRLDLETPLGGPMSSQTIQNNHECLCGRGWSMIGHKRG